MSKTFVLRFPTVSTSFINPQVTKILVFPGSRITRNSDLIEVESEKGIMTIQSEFSGMVCEILTTENQFVVEGDGLLVISKD